MVSKLIDLLKRTPHSVRQARQLIDEAGSNGIDYFGFIHHSFTLYEVDRILIEASRNDLGIPGTRFPVYSAKMKKMTVSKDYFEFSEKWAEYLFYYMGNKYSERESKQVTPTSPWSIPMSYLLHCPKFT